MSRILVIGAHGQVARQLTPLLAAAGHQVTGVFRNPQHREEVAADGATPLVLDIEQADVETLATQIDGHDAVVWSAGAGGGSPARTYAVDRDAAIRSMDAAQQVRVRRYVMVSYIGAGTDQQIRPDDAFFPYAQAKAAADGYLRGTVLDWTILGPGRLTQDVPTGHIALNPGREHRDTSRANVARMIVAALETPGTIGRTLDFVDGQTDIATALAQLG
ncbi:MAG: SDR family oxidoreductase [Pseudoxanthomonas sp.]